jgi:hypothetical protein
MFRIIDKYKLTPMAEFVEVVNWNELKISYFSLALQEIRNIYDFCITHIHSLNQYDMLQQQSPASNVHEDGIC